MKSIKSAWRRITSDLQYRWALWRLDAWPIRQRNRPVIVVRELH
jgi:hypothetical protein